MDGSMYDLKRVDLDWEDGDSRLHAKDREFLVVLASHLVTILENDALKQEGLC